jgi:hypothetical protein
LDSLRRPLQVPIEFAVIGVIRVRTLCKKDAPFGELDSYRELQGFHPCPSVFIRGKNNPDSRFGILVDGWQSAKVCYASPHFSKEQFKGIQ